MPKPLDYAELDKAADAVMSHVDFSSFRIRYREIILAALTAIATRAFKQASRGQVIPSGCPRDPGRAEVKAHRLTRLVVGDPLIPLSDTLAALDAPQQPAQRAVTLDNAEEWYTGDTSDA